MKRRVTQMEEEARKLIELQSQVELGSSSGSIGANKEETDARSCYVGNVWVNTYDTLLRGCMYINFFKVDYGATPEELQAHFQSCGTINRITILCDKFTGHPKGYVLGWDNMGLAEMPCFRSLLLFVLKIYMILI